MAEETTTTTETTIVDEVVEHETKKKKGRKRSCKHGGGFIGKLMSFLLAFVLGIVAGLGGVGGLGYYIVKNKTLRQTADLVKKYTNFTIPFDEYLSQTLIDKTAYGIVESLIDTVGKIVNGTGKVRDLSDLSPKINDMIAGKDGLVVSLHKHGITLDGEALLDKYIIKPGSVKGTNTDYLTDYLLETIKNLSLGDLLYENGFERNEFLDVILYGVLDQDYTEENGVITMKPGKSPLTIADLMSEKVDMMDRLMNVPIDIIGIDVSNSLMTTLAYGASHRYTISGNTVTMNQMFYTYDGVKCYDDNGNELTNTQIAVDVDGILTLTFEDGTSQLAVPDANGKYLVYTNEATPQIVRFPKVTFSGLTDFEELLDGITIASVMGVTESSHAILKAIAYDADGNERTLGDFNPENAAAILDEIELSSLLPVKTNNALMMYILYGKSNVHYSVTGGTVTMLRKQVAVYNSNVFNEYGEFITGAVANGTTYTLDGQTYTLVSDSALSTKTVTISGVKCEAQLYYVQLDGEDVYFQPTSIGSLSNDGIIDKITDRLTLSEFIDVSDTPLRSLGDKTIAEIPDAIDQLTLADFVDVSGHKLLESLGDKKIDEIPAALNSLTIEEVFGDSFYYRTNFGQYRINANGEFIDNANNVVVAPEGERIYMIDINGNETTDKDQALTGSWKYILKKENTGDTIVIEHDATLLDMDHITDNLLNSVHDARLRELSADGMVSLDENTLSQTLITNIMGNPVLINGKPVSEYGTTAGDLTIEQLLGYTSALLKAMPF